MRKYANYSTPKLRFCQFCEKRKHFKDFRFAAMNYQSRAYICRACELLVPPDYPINKGGIYLIRTQKLLIPGRSMNLKARFATYRSHGCEILTYYVWPSEVNQKTLERKLINLCQKKLTLHAGREVFKGGEDEFNEVVTGFTEESGISPDKDISY